MKRIVVGEGKGPVGAYLDIEGIVALAQGKGRGHDPSRLRISFGERRIRPGLRRGGHHLRRAAAGTARDDGRQSRGARAGAEARTSRRCPARRTRSTDRAEALKIAKEIGFPLIIKAAFGGGGRGMRVVHKAADLARLLDEAQGEAGRAFGNPAVFLEKYIPRAKHIEVQILGDQHGNVLHLHERDCSVQRRHQKVVEIAPSRRSRPRRSSTELCDAAVRMAREIGYDNAGTVEFLFDLDTRRMVLHRDEPAHPGGAHGHGSHHRHRSGALADPDRARPCAARPGAGHAARRTTSRATATPSSAASRPKTRKTNSCRTTARSSTYRSRRRLRHPAGWRHGRRRRGHHAVLRFAAGEGHGLRAALSTWRCSAWTARCASSASAA